MVRVTVFVYGLFAGLCLFLAWSSATHNGKLAVEFGKLLYEAAFFAGMLCLVFPPIPLILLCLLVLCVMFAGD